MEFQVWGGVRAMKRQQRFSQGVKWDPVFLTACAD